MDYFFAQLEERESPQFRGKPVVVCTSTPLSVHPSKDIVVISEEEHSDQSANHHERARRVEGWRAEPKEGKGRGVVFTVKLSYNKGNEVECRRNKTTKSILFYS